MRIFRLALIGAAALALAGCGAQNEAASGGAEIVPANAPAFVTVDSNADSSQWQQIEELLKKFPDGGQVFGMVRSSFEGDTKLDWERDVKPALGDEIDLVWLDLKGQGDNLVAVTKPKDKAKFEAAVAKANASDSGDDLVLGELDDWLIFSDSQAKIDRFKQQVPEGDSLADDATYKDALAELPDDSLVTAFARGESVVEALKGLPGVGLGALQLQGEQRPEFVTAALTASDDGFRVAGAARTEQEPKVKVEPFSSQLVEEVPGDAVAYLGFRGGQGVLQQLDQLPNTGVLPLVPVKKLGKLLENEIALYVRPGTPIPEVTLLIEVDDARVAMRDLDEIVQGLVSQAGATSVNVEEAGVALVEVDLGEIKLRYGGFDKRLVLTTMPGAVEELRADGARLDDADAFKDATSAAEMPDENSGFLWVDVEKVAPMILGFSMLGGQDLPPEVRRNLEPLQSLVAWVATDGRTSSFSAFLGID